jgi:hypothetical protein
MTQFKNPKPNNHWGLLKLKYLILEEKAKKEKLKKIIIIDDL